MINFGPGAIYISNPDGTSIGRLDINNCSIECEDEFNYISTDINVVKCCPNRKVAYLATHSKKRRTRKKNFHRAIKILEELAEVNND